MSENPVSISTSSPCCPTCKGTGKKFQGFISYVHIDELCPDKWHDEKWPLTITDATSAPAAPSEERAKIIERHMPCEGAGGEPGDAGCTCGAKSFPAPHYFTWKGYCAHLAEVLTRPPSTDKSAEEVLMCYCHHSFGQHISTTPFKCAIDGCPCGMFEEVVAGASAEPWEAAPEVVEQIAVMVETSRFITQPLVPIQETLKQMANKIRRKFAVPEVPSRRELLNLCAEVYQACGALNAPVQVLDNLVAAASQKALPHKTLLPFADPAPGEPSSAREVEESRSEIRKSMIDSFDRVVKETEKRIQIVNCIERVLDGLRWPPRCKGESR